MKKKTLSYERRAHPAGTLVKVNVIDHSRTVPLGTMGIVIGGCPNPWYNQVQLEDGRVLDLFCEDLALVEV